MNLDSLKQKWHGAPVWVWALGTSLALFLLYYIYKKRAGSSASTTSTTAANTQADNSGSEYDPGSYGGGSGSILFPNEGTTPVETVGATGGAVDTTTSTGGLDTANTASSPTPTTASTTTAPTSSAPSIVRPQIQETTSNVGAIARGDVVAIPPAPDPVEQSLEGQHPGVKIQHKTILPPIANSNVHKPGAQI